MKKQKFTYRILALAMCLCMIFTMIPLSAYATTHEHDAECGYAPARECTHTHDNICGYAEAVEGSACTHNCIDGSCSYVAASDGTPCNHVCDIDVCGYSPAISGNLCNDDCPFSTTGTHNSDCNYSEGEPGTPCTHGHDDSCGYVAPVAGVACDHEHDANCGYAEAVKAQPCIHEHDADCGYSAGSDCTYVEPGDEVITYYVSVNSDNPSWGNLAGVGYYAPGDTVTIMATPHDGYHFYAWVVAQGTIILANASSETTTFTMPGENVTITANLREHKYSICRDNEDGTHSDACLFCDVKGEPEPHALGKYEDNGANGHYANCDSCTYQTTVELHIYDSDSDTECNACGYIREVHTHIWGDYISNGDGSHTRTCTADSNHTETIHCSDGDGNELCDTCNYDMHVHRYSTQYNETYHWEECDCGETGMRGMHTYGDDGVCTACSHAEHNHSWEYRIVNESRHEPYCAGCGETGLQGIHTWKYVPYGADVHHGICTVCQYESNEKIRHENLNPEKDELCDICGADLHQHSIKYEVETGNNTLHRYRCRSCRLVGMEEHVYTIDNNKCDLCDYVYSHTHIWGNYTANGDGTHTRTCNDDNSHYLTEVCRVSEATCHTGAACADCYTSYSEINPANHSGGTETRGAVEATRNKEGYTGDIYCKGCGSMIASGEKIPLKGFVIAKTMDDKSMGTVTVVPPEGVELPEDAEMIVKDYTATIEPVESVVGSDIEIEYITVSDDDINISNPFVVLNGVTFYEYEIVVINGEEFLVVHAETEKIRVMRFSDGTEFDFDGENLEESKQIHELRIEKRENQKLNINGITYDVAAVRDGVSSFDVLILYYDGHLSGQYHSTTGIVSFIEGYDPKTLKAQQQDTGYMGTVTIPEVDTGSKTREQLVADVEVAQKAIEDYKREHPGSFPTNALSVALFDAENALATYDAKAQLTPGMTYAAYEVVAQDISLNGWNEALYASVTGDSPEIAAAKAEVERLKADMEAKWAASEQLDANAPDYMEALLAWYEAKKAYEDALVALAGYKPVTVTQSFRIPAAYVNDPNVIFVAVHDTNPYAEALAEALANMADKKSVSEYLRIKELYDAWEAGYGRSAQLGKVENSADGQTATVTHNAYSFSPFVVYALIEV